MGVEAPAEMKPTEVSEVRSDEAEECPDSWEMADLEASMKRLLPAAHCTGLVEGFGSGSSSSGGDPQAVDEFLREALQNPQDRLTILRLEQEVERFVRNPRQHQLEFPPMQSSYMRLAVHRVAQHYFLLTSVVDSSSGSFIGAVPAAAGAEACRIVVRKSGENKLPSIRLADIPVAWEGGGQSAGTKFVIKQRPQAGGSSGDGLGAASGSGNNPSKTVEERNEEYNKARARIFQHELEQRGYDESQLLEVESRKAAKVPPEAQERHSPAKRSVKADKEKDKDKEEQQQQQAGKSRQKVAIFRDREKDRKDPDYDRNYDRYSQRFDPGFGLNHPPPAYDMHARYTPVVNYNTEFPQLGCPPRPMPPQAVQGWYQGQQQPQDLLRPPFNHPPHPAPHPNMATYMSQYHYSRPSMAAYPYPTHVPQPEASSAQARRQ